jgi:hypothetical protein
MAKVVFGNGIAAMSGKLGGSVAARNKGGAYLRTWVKPTNPQTARQTAVRATLATNAQLWKDQTDATRAAWATWADANPVIDRLGASIVLSGSQAFGKVMNNRTNAGVALTPSVTPAPTSFTADILDSTATLAPSAGAGTVVLVLGAGAAAGQVVFFYASSPSSAGVTNTNAAYRLLGNVTLVGADIIAGTLDIGSLYTDYFGAITAKAGLKIAVAGEQFPNGLLSSDQDQSGIIAA